MSVVRAILHPVRTQQYGQRYDSTGAHLIQVVAGWTASGLGHAHIGPVMKAATVPAGNLGLYALTVGSTPESRAALVRRSNPRRSLRAGRVFTSLRDALARLDEPVFAFDMVFDLVLYGDRAYVLSRPRLPLFRDQQALVAQVPGWTEAVAAHVPMTSDGQCRLTAKALRDRRIASRLKTIVNRGHLDCITDEMLRVTMTAVGLDPDVLLTRDNELELADDHIATVLQFLTEDLFYGAITNVGFRADRKAIR